MSSKPLIPPPLDTSFQYTPRDVPIRGETIRDIRKQFQSLDVGDRLTYRTPSKYESEARVTDVCLIETGLAARIVLFLQVRGERHLLTDYPGDTLPHARYINPAGESGSRGPLIELQKHF